MSRLLDSAGEWIEPYWNADHLRRTLAWLLVLDPEASEGARIAALTHDMERHFPGGPVMDPATQAPDDVAYRCAHSERSARIVGDWLRGEGASEALVAEVQRLILAHEIGGEPDEDVLQAADSLSFLEVNPDLVVRWFRDGSVHPGALEGAARVHVRPDPDRPRPRARRSAAHGGARRCRPRIPC